MAAPVNVKLRTPTIIIPNWNQQEQEWIELNKQVQGNRDFFPLTIKGAYVIGLIYGLCVSVSTLLDNRVNIRHTYFPAYGVFASGIELLGRCVNGNDTTGNTTKDLKTGFKWLAKQKNWNNVLDTDILIQTPSNSNDYSIDQLAALRHFSAHGQATTKQKVPSNFLDNEILAMMPPILSLGLEKYWKELQVSENLCNHLAQANIIALRSSPVLESWILFEWNKALQKYQSVEEIFSQFHWSLTRG